MRLFCLIGTAAPSGAAVAPSGGTNAPAGATTKPGTTTKPASGSGKKSSGKLSYLSPLIRGAVGRQVLMREAR